MPTTQQQPAPIEVAAALGNSYIDHQARGTVYHDKDKARFEALVTAYAISPMNSTLLALSMVGAGTALDALRAACSLGRSLRFHPAGLPSYQVDAEHTWHTEEQRYRLFKRRLAVQQRDHYVLLNEEFFREALEAHEYQCVLAPLAEAPEQTVGRTVRRIATVPILPAWYPHIYAETQRPAGQHGGKHAIALSPDAGFNAWMVKLHDDYWHKVVVLGIEQGAIQVVPHG